MLESDILKAIRDAGGRATLADIVRGTGRPGHELEGSILPALNLAGGHIAVDDNGELVYSVKRTRNIETRSLWDRILSTSYRWFQVVFFSSLTVVLVSYFVFYVLLLVAIAVAGIAAASQGGDCDLDCDGADCDGCDGCNASGDVCFMCYSSPAQQTDRRVLREKQRRVRNDKKIAKVRRRLRNKQERRRKRVGEAQSATDASGNMEYLGLALERESVLEKPRLLRAVRDFIFGPPRPVPDPRAQDKNFLGFISTHNGRITAADAVSITGLPVDLADAILLSVAARYEGDVTVNDDGVILYTFDKLMATAAEDIDTLRWIERMNGVVTVTQFAHHTNTDASQALHRLRHLIEMVGGRIEHLETTHFVFPPDAVERLHHMAERAEALREYTYDWDRMELSPAVIGIPQGGSGWIIGFNLLNLTLAAVLTYVYGSGFPPYTGWSGESLLVAHLPLFFSLAVFAIPLVRLLWRRVTDPKRLERNARRVTLLALFHLLEERDTAIVRPGDIAGLLYPKSKVLSPAYVDRYLAPIVAEMEGSLDVEAGTEGGFAYTFERLFGELHAIRHERLNVDIHELQLAPLVYDSAEELIAEELTVE